MQGLEIGDGRRAESWHSFSVHASSNDISSFALLRASCSVMSMRESERPPSYQTTFHQYPPEMARPPLSSCLIALVALAAAARAARASDLAPWAESLRDCFDVPSAPSVHTVSHACWSQKIALLLPIIADGSTDFATAVRQIGSGEPVLKQVGSETSPGGRAVELPGDGKGLPAEGDGRSDGSRALKAPVDDKTLPSPSAPGIRRRGRGVDKKKPEVAESRGAGTRDGAWRALVFTPAAFSF